ncbi:MAG: superoxide dismutase [Planctomycetes bacterium RBG_16_64_12]|nr:MAG: superoxide dismutase [Planctomycetes bacterium RBG_16_64_12]
MTYALPELPYAYDALEPHIDARTMEIHHIKHHAAYIAKLNQAIEGYDLGDPSIEDLVTGIHVVPAEIRTVVQNHGGGHVNHSLFWTVLGPDGGEPEGDLLRALDDQLGGFEACKEALTKAAMGRFGSGWAWLCVDGDERLVVEDTPNQDSPLMHGHTPILGIDVWEHAYYLKYQNRRADYVAAFFNVVYWENVAARYREALAQKAHAVHAGSAHA